MCEKTVFNFCHNYGIKSCKLLLAVSGGCDSIALFHLFNLMKKRLQISEIGVAHVNHNLRYKESEQEAEFVSCLSNREGFRFHIKELNGKNIYDTGVEQWARDERYRFFKELKLKYSYDFIATGHTMDDQAETVLMRIVRGSGTAGLCGIRTVRDDTIIRPLINLQRKKLKIWLKQRGHTWREDSSNADLHYSRNRIRHIVIPLLIQHEANAVEYLAKLADYMQIQNRFLKHFINKWIDNNVIEDEPERFVLKKNRYTDKDYLAAESVAELFRKHNIPFDKRHIHLFLKETKRTTGCFLLKKGWRFYPDINNITVLSGDRKRDKRQKNFSCRLKIPGTTVCSDAGYRFLIKLQPHEHNSLNYDTLNMIVYLDYQALGTEVTFRTIQKTDIFQPLGAKKKINIINFLNKRMINSFYRSTVGVLTEKSGAIVWIPGVEVSHAYRVSSTTRTVVKISCYNIS